MLLRTRITLIVALGLVLTVLGLGSAGLLREQLLQQRLASTALAAQTSLWGEMLAAEDRLLARADDTTGPVVPLETLEQIASTPDAISIRRSHLPRALMTLLRTPALRRSPWGA